MPKMTHWNSPDTIEVSGEKAAVYQAQGWVSVSQSAEEPKVEAMTRAAASDDGPAKPVKKAATKKTAAKRAAKKA